MRMKIKVAAMIAGAAASVGLAGTAFAHGKPSVHVKQSAKTCNVSVGCGNLNHSLNHNGSGNLSKNKVNVLSGDLNKNKVASGNNVNAPVTVAPDTCGSEVAVAGSGARGGCAGNFHPVNAGQNNGN